MVPLANNMTASVHKLWSWTFGYSVVIFLFPYNLIIIFQPCLHVYCRFSHCFTREELFFKDRIKSLTPIYSLLLLLLQTEMVCGAQGETGYQWLGFWMPLFPSWVFLSRWMCLLKKTGFDRKLNKYALELALSSIWGILDSAYTYYPYTTSNTSGNISSCCS